MFSRTRRQFPKFIRFALEPKNEIVAVADGVEGVKNIQRSDFDVIICDLMMPELPGDQFYRTVERVKPHLCNRFIFMTGYTEDRKIADFIKSIDGLMMHKPFKVVGHSGDDCLCPGADASRGAQHVSE